MGGEVKKKEEGKKHSFSIYFWVFKNFYSKDFLKTKKQLWEIHFIYCKGVRICCPSYNDL